MKNFGRLLTVAFVVIFSNIQMHVEAQTTNYQVYALFVMNIAKYSSWPAEISEFRITVFGKSKIYDELVKLSATKTINGTPIKVNQTDNLSEIGNQEMVFLSDGKSNALNEVLQAAQGRPIMVVAEREGLVKRGAGFSFVTTESNTLRFDINNTDLEKRQIKVSKNLTILANMVL